MFSGVSLSYFGMALLNDLHHIPSTPKSFGGVLANGQPFRIPWDSSQVPYGGFYSKVVKFHTDNNLPVPTTEQVQTHICQQIPASWCNGGQNFSRPAPVKKPCKTCGRGGRGFR